ncbi:MAG: helix-turn-helix domain-containing protein [Alphaproteobacteria bacterium]|nr:helix-turn-helix domain-containing protein [Alphaproteobacteria bacterium]
MARQSYDNVVGKKLRRIRAHLRRSEKEMAEYLKVPLQKYREFESGERQPENFPADIVMLMFIDI